MFQLQDLSEATSDHAIRQTLKDLPIGLYETYQRKLDKIITRRRSDLAQKIFRWISIAVRPLHLEEIQEAVTFDENDTLWNQDKIPHPDVLIGSCENLIIFDDSGGLSFAHHTVRNFFLSNELCTPYDSFHFSLINANIFAAKICVAYLSFTDFEAQVIIKPLTVVDTQSLNPLRTGGLTHLTKTLGISDQWFNLPYRLLGGSQHIVSDDRNLRNEGPHSKVFVPPSLDEKYRFLKYAAQNWLFHSQYFIDRQNPQCPAKDVSKRTLDRFRLLATERVMVFNHKLWGVQSNLPEFPFQTMFIWAMEHSHIPLLWQLGQLGSTVQGPSLGAYLVRNSDKVACLLRTTCIQCQDIFLEFILDECFEDEVSPKSFLYEDHLVWCASLNGHQSIVKMLLDIGISTEAQVPRPDYIPANVGISPARALELAVRKGHTDVVKVLLEHGADVNALDCQGYYPMHYIPNADMVRLLLERDARIDQKIDSSGREGCSPLHCAVIADRAAVVERLLQYNASARVRDLWDKTALHYTNDVAIARMILDFDRQVADFADHKGNTALLSAASKENFNLVKLLCEYRAAVNAKNTDGQTALVSAASKGNLDLVKLLCEYGADVDAVNTDGNTVILSAASKGDLDLVKLLCEYRAAVNAVDTDGNTALLSAASQGNLDLVGLLCEYGAVLNALDADGNTAQSSAASKGNLDIYLYLRDQGASMTSVNHLGNTALHEACAAGREEVVEAMLDGAYGLPQKDAKNREGQTPWSLASFGGHADIVRMLMQAGVTEIDPLHLAVTHGQAEVIDVLLDMGLSIDSEDQYGRTVLFLAVECGAPSTVHFLLSRQASINGRYHDLSTPLMVAASKHDRSFEAQRTVQILLEAGADVNLRNVRDETALFLAVKSQNYEIAELIMARGADPTIISRPTSDPRSWQRPLQVLQVSPAKIDNTYSRQAESKALMMLVSSDADTNSDYSEASMMLDSLTSYVECWESEHPNHFTDQIEPEVWIQILRDVENDKRSALHSRHRT